MNNSITFIAAALVLTLASCTAEPLPIEDEGEITITATMAENNTKTIIQEGTTKVLWEPADEVKVFYKTTGSKFTSNNSEPVGVADFTGNLTITGFFSEGFSADTPLWGLYPYRADAVSDGESVTTTLRSLQTGRAGSFAKGMNITLAKSTNTKMAFYNVCGGIRFTLTQEGIKEVVFQGQNDEDIAGVVKVAFSEGLPAVQEIIEGQKTITLSAPEGGAFETGQWYYIVALPGILSNGFKMTFNTDTQYATLKSSGSKTIKRGIFGSLVDADEDLVFKDKEGGEPPITGNIVFADPIAKSACVAKFDTDGDGEVSVEEAEAVTSFDGLFDNWKTITSFNEISYFKNVHSISGVFNGCYKLTSISIPENITDLGNYAFSNCSLLSSVVLPSSITMIGDYTFQKCSSLISVNIPSGVTAIGNNAFYGCTNLTQISLPDSLTSLGKKAFEDCSSLTQISIPIGVTSIPASCFFNCRSLASITLPEGITSIGATAFNGANMWKLELPSSVSSIGGSCFGSGIVCVILPSATPISVQSSTFDGVTGIFVPFDLIDVYRRASDWSNCSSRLHSIDTYKNKDEFILATSGAVNMGTSVKWAAYNVGATKPDEIGDYFAWGETEPKENYTWRTYKFNLGTNQNGPFSKYVTSSAFGNVDNKTVLDPENDAAHVNWGGSWRMPTEMEGSELKQTCFWELTSYGGINGFLVYGIGGDGHIIFFPRVNRTYVDDGHYWLSSLYSSGAEARSLDLYSSNNSFGVGHYVRYLGFSVRPVCE